jgi:transcriptional regulator with XRE-family HTH domain
MKKKTTTTEFGKRLAYFRKAKGLTQKELGEMVKVSNRVIAYYEGETDYPPAHLIVPLADALGTTTDELFGKKKGTRDFDIHNAALWRKLKVVGNLPPKDRKAVLHYIDMTIKSNKFEQKENRQ